MNLSFRSILVLSLLSGAGLRAQAADPAPNSGETPSAEKLILDPFVVNGKLDVARESIVPELGASSFHIDMQQIQVMPQGADAPFSQVLLRVPGVAQDSAGNSGLHVRGEHANLQYRINDVLLPEGISGFGLELDPRFVNSLQFVTGSLPAQYGFRTAGVVDIHTNSGTVGQGGSASHFQQRSSRDLRFVGHRPLSAQQRHDSMVAMIHQAGGPWGIGLGWSGAYC